MTEQNNKGLILRKSVARLIACQALCVYYNENNENKNIFDILSSINQYYIEDKFSDENGNCLYNKVFKSNFVHNLVKGVIVNSEKFDVIINDFLQKQDTTGTIDDVILQSFRLAIYELKFTDTNKNVIVNEYVNIIAEFYDGIYITFSNGILDNIASYIRDGKRKEVINTTNENKNIEEKMDKIKKVTRNTLTLKHKTKD